MIKISRLILLTLLITISTAASSVEFFGDHAEVCGAIKGNECLELINKKRSAQIQYSLAWYQTTNYYLDYYYDNQEFKKLLNVTSNYLEKENHPTLFQTRLYYYQAKSLLFFKQREQAKVYADKAFSSLEKIADAFPNPMRSIEIANLKHVFGDSKEAYAMLHKLQITHSNHKDALFHVELQSNMGHAMHNLGNLEQAAKHRTQSANWALKSNDLHLISIETGNLARTYQLLEQYQQALETYQFTITYLEKTKNVRLLAATYVRLVEIATSLANEKLAKQYYDLIEPSLLSHYHIGIYDTYSKIYEKN